MEDISKIFNDNLECWNEIKDVCQILRNEKAKIKRGFSSGYNDFYFKDCLTTNLKLSKCISNPRKLKGYKTNPKCYEKYLHISKSMLDDNVIEYIKYHEKIVLENKNPLVIYTKILNKEKWFLDSPKKEKKGSLIFSYIIRDKKNKNYIKSRNYY